MRNQKSIIFIVSINDEFPKILKNGEGSDKVPHREMFTAISYLKRNNIKNIDYVNFPLLYLNNDKIKNFFSEKKSNELKKKYFTKLMIQEIKKYDVYFFFVPLWNENLEQSLNFAKELKEKNHESLIVFFGPCCTLFPDQIICNDFIDYVIISETEEACYGIITEKINDDIPNICFKENDKLVFTKEKGFSMNKIDYYLDYRLYFEFIKKNGLVKPLFLFFEFSRGCIYDCFFCSLLTNKKIRYKELEFAQNELKNMLFETKVNNIFFTDNELNFDIKYIEKFLDFIIAEKIKFKWTSYMVAKGITKDILFKMKKAGCIFLRWGIESVNPKRQKTISKNLDIAEVERILRDSHDLGIVNQVSFTIGYPYDCDLDCSLILKFIDENHKNIDCVNLNKFKPRRRSNVFDKPENYGISILSSSVKKDEVPFNELNGLDWELKKEQQDYYFNKIILKLKEYKLKDYDPEIYFEEMVRSYD